MTSSDNIFRESDLPAPIINEAIGDRLNPADVPDGATVDIEASAALLAGDVVTMLWSTQGNVINLTPHAVTAGEANQALTLRVEYDIVLDSNNSTVTLQYVVARTDGSLQYSPLSIYYVTDAISNQR